MRKEFWSEKQRLLEKIQERNALVARIRSAVAFLRITHDCDE